MSKIPIHKLSLLRHRPLVVGTLVGSDSLSSQLSGAKLKALDVIEVRFDTFPQIKKGVDTSVGCAVFKQIKRKTKIPLLLTLRSFKEAGRSVPSLARLSDKERWRLIKPLLPLVQAVDVEIGSSFLIRQLKPWAKKLSLIHSAHFFHSVPSVSKIKRDYQRSARQNGHIFKVAVAPRRVKDMWPLWTWALTLKNPKPVVIGMGKTGQASRWMGYSFGSVLTYGFLGRTTAPGQPSVTQLSRVIKKMYPKTLR